VSIANSHTLQFNTPCASLSVWLCLTSHCLVMTSMADVSLILGSQAIAVPQLPASNSNSSKQLKCRPLAHQSTLHFPAPQCTNSERPDSPNCPDYNILAWISQKTLSSLLVHWCMLGICCLAAGNVYTVIT
jgi:hypothetical protein